MNPFDRLPHDAAEVFGEGATAADSYGLLTVDVPAAAWLDALRTARDDLRCAFFDWLSAVDEPGTGFQVSAHLADAGAGRVRHLLIRTTVPHDAPELPTAVGVFAGAAWHERETHEMFGVVFTGHPHLVPLLLPENFEGHPLRKDFVLAARVAKAWPGAKEPGESSADHAGPKRRQMLPPGVPDPNDWGPLKGQLPPAPARPARTPRAAGATGARGTGAGGAGTGARAAGAGMGAAGAGADAGARAAAADAGAPGAGAGARASGADAPGEAAPARPARRARSVSDGSASQQAEAAREAAREAAPEVAPEAATPETAPEAPKPEAARAPRRRTDNAPWDRPTDTATGDAADEHVAPDSGSESDTPTDDGAPDSGSTSGDDASPSPSGEDEGGER